MEYFVKILDLLICNIIMHSAQRQARLEAGEEEEEEEEGEGEETESPKEVGGESDLPC